MIDPHPHPLLLIETPAQPDPDPFDDDGRMSVGDAMRVWLLFALACWAFVVIVVLLVRAWL